MAIADVIRGEIGRTPRPEFEYDEGTPGYEFAERYAFDPAQLMEDPYYQRLETEAGEAGAVAGARVRGRAGGRGFGRSTFTEALSEGAAGAAAAPYKQSQAGLANLLRQMGFQADVAGLGLQQDIYGQDIGQRQFELQNIFQAISAEEANRLRGERERRASQLNLMQTILQGGALAAGTFFGGPAGGVAAASAVGNT